MFQRKGTAYAKNLRREISDYVEEPLFPSCMKPSGTPASTSLTPSRVPTFLLGRLAYSPAFCSPVPSFYYFSLTSLLLSLHLTSFLSSYFILELEVCLEFGCFLAIILIVQTLQSIESVNMLEIIAGFPINQFLNTIL